MVSYPQQRYLAQKAAAEAAARAARQRWQQQQARRNKPPGSPSSTPGSLPDPVTTPPGSPTNPPSTYSTGMPNSGQYYEDVANAERAWREAQAEINRSRSRLATGAGYTYQGGQYQLDPYGAGSFQQTTREFGNRISDIRDNAAARGMVSGAGEDQARAGYSDAMRQLQQNLVQGEGDLAGAELRAQNKYTTFQADALKDYVWNAINGRNFDPAAVPDDVPDAPTTPESPASGSPTPKMKYWGVEFLPWQWDIFVKKAHARGQDPNRLLLTHPGLRKFFNRK